MKKILVGLLALGCALLVSTPALADACLAGDEFCLTFSNQNQFNPGDITVHVNISGSTVTVEAHANVAGITNLVFDHIAFNNTSGGQLFTGVPANWVIDANPDSDGFAGGPFPSGASCSGNAATCDPNDGGPMNFTLSGAPTFGNGTIFVVHIRYEFNGQGCSAYISNATTPGGVATPNGECGGTEIPEPGSLALLGTGLFSAVGVLRRKLLKA
jgi:hypothetical protein